MATEFLWAGLKVTTATRGANQHANSIPVGGAKVYHGNPWSQSHRNSIPVGGAKGYHGNTLSQSHGNITRRSLAWLLRGFGGGRWARRRLPWRLGVPVVVVVLGGDEDDDGEDGAQHGGGHADGQGDEGEVPRLPRGHLGLSQVPPSHRRADLSN